MDLLSLIATCSLYADKPLVHAVVRVHSRGLVHFVADGRGENMPTYAPGPESGREALQRIAVAGGRPLVGLMSVPLEWAKDAGKKPEALFDACTNLRIGTERLQRFDAACRAQAPGASQPQLRACVAGRYGAAIGVDVLAEAVATSLRVYRAHPPPTPPVEEEAEASDLFVDAGGADFEVRDTSE